MRPLPYISIQGSNDKYNEYTQSKSHLLRVIQRQTHSGMNTICKGPTIRAVRKIVIIVYTELAEDNADVRRDVVGVGQLPTLFLTVL